MACCARHLRSPDRCQARMPLDRRHAVRAATINVPVFTSAPHTTASEDGGGRGARPSPQVGELARTCRRSACATNRRGRRKGRARRRVDNAHQGVSQMRGDASERNDCAGLAVPLRLRRTMRCRERNRQLDHFPIPDCRSLGRPECNLPIPDRRGKALDRLPAILHALPQFRRLELERTLERRREVHAPARELRA